eukprot:Filipodium_phascolosomae@DN1200_c0_g1_i1.p1
MEDLGSAGMEEMGNYSSDEESSEGGSGGEEFGEETIRGTESEASPASKDDDKPADTTASKSTGKAAKRQAAAAAPEAQSKKAKTDKAETKSADATSDSPAAGASAKKPKASQSEKGSAPSPAVEAEYLKAITDFLKENGKASLSDIGSKVKKPEGCKQIKLKKLLGKGPFLLAGSEVSLKE